jgi:lipopolysaccharide heptosyltransferase II
VNILLIRLRLIGDVVFTTPVIRALKRKFPDARLTYLVEREAAPVVAGNPHLDEVIVVPRRRGMRRVVDDIKLGIALRRRRFDLVIDMHSGPRSGLLTLAAGAPQRIGYRVKGRSWIYTRAVGRARELRPRHSVVNQWDLLEAIDGWSGEAPDPRRDAVEMAANPAAERRISERLRAADVGGHHELILIHVSAGNPFRRWPEPAFTELVTALAAAGERRRLILSSGPSDRDAARRIADAARAALGPDRAARVVDFGDFDLAELRALVVQSRLFIGGDTGPMHVAATTTTPMVGIYGPTLPARSAPWRDRTIPSEAIEIADLECRPCEQRVCAPGDFRCLTTVTPQQVIAAAERALAPAGVRDTAEYAQYADNR